MNLQVSVEDLRQVANNLLSEKDKISDIYNKKIVSILDNSKDAISASGVNFDEFRTTFSNVFSRLSTNLENLSNALTNEIIPKYNDLNSFVGKSFNVDFANEMNSLLGKINQ